MIPLMCTNVLTCPKDFQRHWLSGSCVILIMKGQLNHEQEKNIFVHMVQSVLIICVMTVFCMPLVWFCLLRQCSQDCTLGIFFFILSSQTMLCFHCLSSCSNLLSANKLFSAQGQLTVKMCCQPVLKMGQFRKTFQVTVISCRLNFTDHRPSYCCYSNLYVYLFFSARAAGNETIGIDLGTTNSCVSVMEGKVRSL